ncbi:MAG: hypothetical protein SWX82_34925 [Cyanobacteriota bacterium]|nr:hypothetical protein [Cyanobacteriota bacterium]
MKKEEGRRKKEEGRRKKKWMGTVNDLPLRVETRMLRIVRTIKRQMQEMSL